MSKSTADLSVMQAWTLGQKIEATKCRISEWHELWEGKVYISFSGGKDSTVLLRIARELFPDIPAVFCDTGLEFPEVRAFAMNQDNVTTVKPKKTFRQVLMEEGYPVVSKKVSRFVCDLQNPTPNNERTRNLRLTGVNSSGKKSPSMKLALKHRYLIDAPFKVSSKCCDILKKSPLARYTRETERKPITGQMVDEGGVRRRVFLLHGCNVYRGKHPISNPMSFWTEQDVLEYISKTGLEIASVYGDISHCAGSLCTTGERRTGCIFCMFGLDYDGRPNRFERLEVTHPKLYRYCMGSLGLANVLAYMNKPYGGFADEAIE